MTARIRVGLSRPEGAQPLHALAVAAVTAGSARTLRRSSRGRCPNRWRPTRGSSLGHRGTASWPPAFATVPPSLVVVAIVYTTLFVASSSRQ